MQRNNIKEICNVKLLHIFRFTVYLLVNPAFCRIRLVKELWYCYQYARYEAGNGHLPSLAQNRPKQHKIAQDCTYLTLVIYSRGHGTLIPILIIFTFFLIPFYLGFKLTDAGNYTGTFHYPSVGSHILQYRKSPFS